MHESVGHGLGALFPSPSDVIFAVREAFRVKGICPAWFSWQSMTNVTPSGPILITWSSYPQGHDDHHGDNENDRVDRWRVRH